MSVNDIDPRTDSVDAEIARTSALDPSMIPPETSNQPPGEQSPDEQSPDEQSSEEMESLNDYIGRLLAQIDLAENDSPADSANATQPIAVEPAQRSPTGQTGAPGNPVTSPYQGSGLLSNEEDSFNHEPEPARKTKSKKTKNTKQTKNQPAAVAQPLSQEEVTGRIVRSAYGVFAAVLLLAGGAAYLAWTTAATEGVHYYGAVGALGLAYLGALRFFRLSKNLSTSDSLERRLSPQHED